VPEERYDFGLTRYARPDADGVVHAPTEPGLGAELDWEWIRAHTVDA
jgi:L-alanine-DL-glutamate epimerase-like enolase superfamily enzyme